MQNFLHGRRRDSEDGEGGVRPSAPTLTARGGRRSVEKTYPGFMAKLRERARTRNNAEQHQRARQVKETLMGQMFDGANVNEEIVAGIISSEKLMGTLPPSDQHIKDGVLEKRSADQKWQSRRMILTPLMVAFTNQGEDKLKDSIPLHEIEKVKVIHGSEALTLLEQMEAPDDEMFGKDQLLEKMKSRLDSIGKSLHWQVLEIYTVKDGYNSGRCYTMRGIVKEGEVEGEIDQWGRQIEEYSKACKAIHASITTPPFKRIQNIAGNFYNSTNVQIFIAILIFGNFIANAAQSEMLPEEGTSTDQAFQTLDGCFTWLFTVELLINMVANWFWPFVTDGWSMFDFVVVTVSLTSLAFQNIPGVSTLRLMRAFRVMRLFGRLQSLRQIITSLTSSILPVLNAFLIMLLVTSIYAILSVNFFRKRSEEYFGTFTRALFTLFQVSTGDGWSSDVARPLFRADSNGVIHDDRHLDPGAAIFFISFIVIVGWTLLQVVVAVLLDNFTAAADKEKERIAQEKRDQEGRVAHTMPLDPLLGALAHFDTSTDLVARINLLFEVLDVDDNASLSYEEMSQGLKKLRVEPSIALTPDDFETMTQGGQLLNSSGEIGKNEFQALMRRQLKLYVQRQLANTLEMQGSDGFQGAVLFVLKLLMIGVDDIQDRQEQTGQEDSVPATDGASGAATAKHGSTNERLSRLERKMSDMQGGINEILARLGDGGRVSNGDGGRRGDRGGGGRSGGKGTRKENGERRENGEAKEEEHRASWGEGVGGLFSPGQKLFASLSGATLKGDGQGEGEGGRETEGGEKGGRKRSAGGDGDKGGGEGKEGGEEAGAGPGEGETGNERAPERGGRERGRDGRGRGDQRHGGWGTERHGREGREGKEEGKRGPNTARPATARQASARKADVNLDWKGVMKLVGLKENTPRLEATPRQMEIGSEVTRPISPQRARPAPETKDGAKGPEEKGEPKKGEGGFLDWGLGLPHFTDWQRTSAKQL